MKPQPRYVVRTPLRVLYETGNRDLALGALGNAVIDGAADANIYDREAGEVIA